eukprot:scaffold150499_cov31-Tisochrysis_lutea.AAC.1
MGLLKTATIRSFDAVCGRKDRASCARCSGGARRGVIGWKRSTSGCSVGSGGRPMPPHLLRRAKPSRAGGAASSPRTFPSLLFSLSLLFLSSVSTYPPLRRFPARSLSLSPLLLFIVNCSVVACRPGNHSFVVRPGHITQRAKRA